MIRDTCFLIDLQREASRQQPGRATAFLEAHADAVFSLSVISMTEFVEGFARPLEGARLLRAYRKLPVDEQVAGKAAEFRRHLRLRGELIGDFDILIAATAVTADLALVTTNHDHFSRLPELKLVHY
jgi:predicted nucleic acid-binding protein